MDGPPKAPVHETEDEYFGTKIKDPYRWMENIKQDPEVQQWLKAQADFTRQTLDSMPGLREAQGAHRRTDQQRAGDNLAAASAGERESFLLENARRSNYSQTL